MIINSIVIFLMSLGLFFFFAGTIGILRFPDFYSRLHPAGKLDSLAQLLCITAMALYIAKDGHFHWVSVQTGLKALLIVIFVFITSPTATHAIVDAGFRAGLGPFIKEKTRDEKGVIAP